MNNRYVGALVLAPLLVLLFLGGWFLKIGVLFLSLRAMYEVYYVLSKKGHKPIYLLGFAGWLAYYSVLLFVKDPLAHLAVIVALMVAVGFISMVFLAGIDITDVGITITGFLYTSVFFSFLILLGEMEMGNYYVPLVFVISWVCDTMAYYSGRLFGRHKLIERVSPKKTVEGAVGGLIGGAVGAAVLGYVIVQQSSGTLLHFILIGALGAFFGQIGDLAASAIKRYAGEKDYPKIIPGHGGILDRFDSILFVALIVYTYITYVF